MAATFAAADSGMEFQGYSPYAKELVIDPRDPMRLFALTNAGLFMSRRRCGELDSLD